MAKTFAELTEDTKLKAEYQKLDDLLASEENREKFSKMTTPEEVFAFFEENGYTYTDEMKREIIKFADQHKNEELSEDDLAEVAGGWGWFEVGFGTVFGGLGGAAVGAIATATAVTGPIGWVVGGCALVGAAMLGGSAALLT